MPTNLVIFKNGLEVIAQTQLGNDEAGTPTVILKNPVRCMIAPNETQNGANIQFGPISPILEMKQSLEVDSSEILFMASLIDEVRNAYDGAFGSGIITANPNAMQHLQNNPYADIPIT